MSSKKNVVVNAKTKYGTEYTKVDVESGDAASAAGVTPGKKFDPWTSPAAVIGWLVVLMGAYVVYTYQSGGAGTLADAAPSSTAASTKAPSANHFAAPEPVDLTKPIPKATGDIRADIASGATNLPFGVLEEKPEFEVHKTNDPNDPYNPQPPAPEVLFTPEPPSPEVLLAALGDAMERAW